LSKPPLSNQKKRVCDLEKMATPGMPAPHQGPPMGGPMPPRPMGPMGAGGMPPQMGGPMPPRPGPPPGPPGPQMGGGFRPLMGPGGPMPQGGGGGGQGPMGPPMPQGGGSQGPQNMPRPQFPQGGSTMPRPQFPQGGGGQFNPIDCPPVYGQDPRQMMQPASHSTTGAVEKPKSKFGIIKYVIIIAALLGLALALYFLITRKSSAAGTAAAAAVPAIPATAAAAVDSAGSTLVLPPGRPPTAVPTSPAVAAAAAVTKRPVHPEIIELRKKTEEIEAVFEALDKRLLGLYQNQRKLVEVMDEKFKQFEQVAPAVSSHPVQQPPQDWTPTPAPVGAAVKPAGTPRPVAGGNVMSAATPTA
jgi:hypothetical protein